jgi:hypothetical protein
MSGRAWVLLCLVLVIGLAVGFGIAALVGGGSATRIRNAVIQVGDEAPDFRLPDHTGRYARLSDFRGQQNVVVAFYPLAWTPV